MQIASALMLGLAASALTPITTEFPSPPARLPQADGQTEDISIGEDRRDRMTVSTMVDGKGPYEFLIDTGAERTVISAELADRLDLDQGRGAKLHSMSGVGNVSTVVIPRLQVGRNQIHGIHAPALKQAHIGAAGMLGIDALQSQRVTFDFAEQKMTVAASRTQQIAAEPNTIVVTARSRLGRLVLVDARLDGQKLKVVLDTGSEVTIGNEALRRKLIGKKKMGQTLPVQLLSVTGNVIQADYTRVKRVRLGGVLINDLPVAFADVHPFRQMGLNEEPALLLGMDSLRLFERVTVDFANRKVRFTHPSMSAQESQTRLAMAR